LYKEKFFFLTRFPGDLNNFEVLKYCTLQWEAVVQPHTVRWVCKSGCFHHKFVLKVTWGTQFPLFRAQLYYTSKPGLVDLCSTTINIWINMTHYWSMQNCPL